ncbi:MAG: hypothetical protein AB7S38_13070 [Vulcanimicrobiota bacterium]
MMTAAFFFLLITGSAAVVALGLTRGQTPAIKLAVVVGLEVVALPLAATYGAYRADRLMFEGRQRACQSNLKNLAVAVELYAADFQAPPARLSLLTPDYLRQIPTCPGHQLAGAYDSDSKGQEYWLGPTGPACPNPAPELGYVHWLKSRN